MTTKPLLEFWDKPQGAGDPLGLIATTFTIDPDFFENACLARFLSVQSVDEGTGSVEDMVGRLELEESLRAPIVTVLADRSAQAERQSLRWDLLHCHVPGGLLHSKVAILLWENEARVLLGSANLTPAGYRRNIELALAADLGPNCLFPPDVLQQLADEVESYLDLVPGLNDRVPAYERARSVMEVFRDRIARHSSGQTAVTVTLAPTNRSAQPLGVFNAAWGKRSKRPLEATQVSPFWDSNSTVVTDTINDLLTGSPAAARRHRVAVVVDHSGNAGLPPIHRDGGLIDDVVELGPLDQEIRSLHAKCLLIRSQDRVAVLMGSSNHTRAGLGLGGPRRHRELNVWLVAPSKEQAGKALLKMLPLGATIHPNDLAESCFDEDEPDDIVALHVFFQLCRLARTHEGWNLVLTFEPSESPGDWRVLAPDQSVLIDHAVWRRKGSPPSFTAPVESAALPGYLDVEWDGSRASWVVVADDRQALPPSPQLKELRADQLLAALAAGKPLRQALTEALREALDREGLPEEDVPDGVSVDFLKLHDSRSTLLRRGRALAASLSALERRLSRTAMTVETLSARMSGPYGPNFIAERIVADWEQGVYPRADAIFTIAEIALVISRVAWEDVLHNLDRDDGLALVADTLDELEQDVTTLSDSEASDLNGYAKRALKEARRCLEP